MDPCSLTKDGSLSLLQISFTNEHVIIKGSSVATCQVIVVLQVENCLKME